VLGEWITFSDSTRVGSCHACKGLKCQTDTNALAYCGTVIYSTGLWPNWQFIFKFFCFKCVGGRSAQLNGAIILTTCIVTDDVILGRSHKTVFAVIFTLLAWSNVSDRGRSLPRGGATFGGPTG